MENTSLSQTSTTRPPKTPNALTRLRRVLLVVAGIATLIASFYTFENWRGKRAWENCKHKYEAQGYVMDWSALIPQPVPDDQNFFKAPHMSDWMVGRGNRKITELIGTPPTAPTNVLIAEIKVIDGNTKPALSANLNDRLIQYDDPNIASNVTSFIENILGPSSPDVIDGRFVTKVPKSVNPPTLYIQSTESLTGRDIAGLFKKENDFRIQSPATNTYRLFSNNLLTAADFLQWSEGIDKHLDPIREALKRPYARMDGDYERPMDVPIPNFVVFRQIAQLLANRAKVYLLQNKPDQALEQLTFIHDLCRALEARPAKKPMTLVAAMINVAIQGLYAGLIAEGFERHTWREPQLRELQKQAAEINVLPFVESAIEGERISSIRLLQSSKSEVASIFGLWIGKGPSPTSAWKRWQNPAYVSIRLAPRGWYYQNMVSIADAMQPVINVFDKPQNQISPQKAGAAMIELNRLVSHPTPYNYVATLAIPNFIRAFQTAAKNQTWINLAYLACALERYHLAHKQYPETLNALIPQFADHIPHDVINGQPLHYQRTDDGRFKLYSVGWDEKHDGGLPEHSVNGEQTGDWVWQYPLP